MYNIVDTLIIVTVNRSFSSFIRSEVLISILRQSLFFLNLNQTSQYWEGEGIQGSHRKSSTSAKQICYLCQTWIFVKHGLAQVRFENRTQDSLQTSSPLSPQFYEGLCLNDLYFSNTKGKYVSMKLFQSERH